MKALWFAVAISVLAGLCSSKHFMVSKQGSDDPCILLDVEFNIEVKALEDDSVIKTETFTSQDRNLEVKGNCGNETNMIGVFFRKNSFWAVEFVPDDDHPVAIYRVFRFIPAEIFTELINETEPVDFTDPTTVYLKNTSHSFKCDVSNTEDYIIVPPPTKYTYLVNVIVSTIQTQGMGLTDSKYGQAEVCTAPVETSTTTLPHPITHAQPTKVHPVTHVTKVHPATHVTKVHPVTQVPPTQVPTPGPKAPVNNYSAKNGKTVCIAMDTSLSFEMTYTTTTQKQKTVTVNVPEDARSNGKCDEAQNKQVLNVTFFNDWVFTLTFAQETEPKKFGLQSIFNKAPSEPSYRINNMTLFVVLDERIFPGHMVFKGHNYTVVPESKSPEFITKSAHTAYYSCDSKSTFVLNKDVKVMFSHLKFKAFNNDEKMTFSGSADVCAGDQTKSNAGLIVGVTITVIVVVAVAVLVAVMLVRRRKKNYESIQ